MQTHRDWDWWREAARRSPWHQRRKQVNAVSLQALKNMIWSIWLLLFMSSRLSHLLLLRTSYRNSRRPIIHVWGWNISENFTKSRVIILWKHIRQNCLKFSDSCSKKHIFISLIDRHDTRNSICIYIRKWFGAQLGPSDAHRNNPPACLQYDTCTWNNV